MNVVLDYETTMTVGATRYQDVLDHLAGSGLRASFTQTGGMNAAIEIMLDGGYTVLVTDAEDSLAWDRDEHRGWGVGLYPPDQANTDGQCLAFDSSDDGTPQALPTLVRTLLRRFTRGNDEAQADVSGRQPG